MGRLAIDSTENYKVSSSGFLLNYDGTTPYQTICSGIQATTKQVIHNANSTDIYFASNNGVDNYIGVLKKNGSKTVIGTVSKPCFCSTFCLRVPDNITSNLTEAPGFLFFYFDDDEKVCVNHVSVRDKTVIDNVIVWDNELGAIADDIRIFDTPYGPCLAIVANSGYKTGKKGLYFKFLNEASATTAKELIVDFDIGNLEAILENSHVICSQNGCFIIYYKLEETINSEIFVAVGYTSFFPIISGITSFANDRIHTVPYPLFYDYFPSLGSRGASYNFNNGRIVVILENKDGVQYCVYSDGYGVLHSSNMTIIHDQFEYAKFQKFIEFGNKQYTEISASTGTTFYCFGYFIFGSIPATSKAFYWTFGLDVVDNKTLKHPIMAEIDINPKTGIISDVGLYSIENHVFQKYSLNNSDKNGYNLSENGISDPYVAILASEFEEIVQIKQIKATVGKNGTSTLTVPSSGIRGYAREFLKVDSRIEFPDLTGYLTSDSVTVSFWVYVETMLIGSETKRCILNKTDNNDSPTYAIYWDEINSRFSVGYHDQIGVDSFTFNTTVLNSVPTNHWYHITFVYNADLELASLYLFGKLVNQVVVNGALVNDGPSSITLGDALSEGGPRSFRGRLDSLVVGSRLPASHAAVLESFAYEISGQTGPVYNSRIKESADKTTGCFQFQKDPLDPYLYSIVVREVDFIGGFETIGLCTFIDFYKRKNNEEPVYVKTFSTPEFTNSAMNDISDIHAIYGTLSECRLTKIEGFYSDISGELTVFIAFKSSIDGDLYTFISKGTLFPFSNAVSSWTKVAVLNTTNFQLSFGMTLIYNLVIVISGFDGIGRYVYFINPPNYGDTAMDLCPRLPISSFIPAQVKTNNNIDISAIDIDIRMCGIVNRFIVSDLGFEYDLQSNIQLIYGLAMPQVFNGNTDDTLVATAHVVLKYLSIGLGILELLTEPIGLDYYGEGGISPFYPIKLLDAPLGSLRTSGVLILGYEGPSTFPIDFQSVISDGEGNICLYQANNDAITNICKITRIPFISTENNQYLKYIDIEYVFTTDGVGVPVYGLSILRPYYNNIDSLRITYFKDKELVAFGYNPPDPLPLYNPVVSNFKLNSPLWTDIRYTRKTLEYVRPKQPIIETKLFDMVYKAKGILPGYTASDYSLTPNTMYIRCHNVFYFSSKNVVRGFFGDSTLHAGITGVNINTGGNIAISSSLGTIGLADTNVWPIGIVELDGTYFYYYIEFQASGFVTIKCYTGSIDDFSGSVVTAWTCPALLPVQCYENMRVLVHNNEIYCYFLITSEFSSSLFHIKLVPGEVVTDSPVSIVHVPFKISGRFYCVSDEYVICYFGSTDNVVPIATYYLLHDPISRIIVKEVELFKSGVAPYARSNAILKYSSNNVDFILMYLEGSDSAERSGGFSGEYGDKFKVDKDSGLDHSFCIAYNHGAVVYDFVTIDPVNLQQLYIDQNGLENVINNVCITPCALLQKTPNSFEVVFGVFDRAVTTDPTFRYKIGGSEKDTFNFNRLTYKLDKTVPEPSVTGAESGRNLAYRAYFAELIVTLPNLLQDDLILDIGHEYSRNEYAKLTDASSKSGLLNGDTGVIQPLWDHVQGAKVLVMRSDQIVSVFLLWNE